jgi:hypothetical protein
MADLPAAFKWYVANYYNESVTDASGAVFAAAPSAVPMAGKWRPGGPGRPPKNREPNGETEPDREEVPEVVETGGADT